MSDSNTAVQSSVRTSANFVEPEEDGRYGSLLVAGWLGGIIVNLLLVVGHGERRATSG